MIGQDYELCNKAELENQLQEKDRVITALNKHIDDLGKKLGWMCEVYKTPALLPTDIKDWWNFYKTKNQIEKAVENMRNEQKAALAKLTPRERELLCIREDIIKRI